MPTKLTTQQFIERAREKHGDKYDYSRVEYANAKTKVCIICPEHGEFWQKPYLHLHGNKCPKCCGFNRTTKEFIEKAKEVHGDKYDYSKTEYNGSHSKITIICPEHGEFQQIAKEHLKYGCKKCADKLVGDRVRLNTDEFIKRAKNIHGNKYDYSKVEYINCDKPVCIICPEHGEFWQTPHTHLSIKIHGCPFCANERNINEEKLYNKLISYYQNKHKIVRQKKFHWLKNKKRLSLDFYIEDLDVAIEYQGLQHYTDIQFFDNNFEYQHNNDLIKIKLCKENGVKLLHFSFDKKIKNYNIEYDTINDFNELITKINNG